MKQCGNSIYLKPENMQFTGAYKVRGAYYKISTLTDEERQKGLITASAGNHAQGVAYAAKMLWRKGNDRYADHHAAHQGKPYQEAMAQRLSFTAMYMMRHAQRLTSWQRSMDIPLSILSMIWHVATGQGTIAMEIIKELPLVDYILVPIGGGGLCYRCINTGKTVESEDQGDRCRAGRRKLYAGIHQKRKSNDPSDGQHDRRWYCSKDARDAILFPYIQKNLG